MAVELRLTSFGPFKSIFSYRIGRWVVTSVVDFLPLFNPNNRLTIECFPQILNVRKWITNQAKCYPSVMQKWRYGNWQVMRGIRY